MRKYLDLTSWILLFFFAPFTVLILLSQNTIPGDFFYPVKRGLENIILVAASVSPNTKVAYRTDLTQRRFTEAQTLLVSKADTTAYNEFIDQVFVTSQDLSKISSTQDKIESSEKLLAKIEEYQIQLNQVENQVQIAQGLPIQPIQPVSEQTSITQQPIQTQPQPQSQTPIPSSTLTPTQTQAPLESSAPSQTAQPSVVQTTAPTSTPAPTLQPLTPSVTNTIANNPIIAGEVKEKIKDTKEHLEKIKEQVKREKEEAEVREKIREEQKKLQENLKEQENSVQQSITNNEERGKSGSDENND